jgi:arylsulfatase
VGDFIDYLRRRRVIDNTTIFLYPDHLKMGTPPTCGDPNDRRLYVISNSASLPQSQKKLYQIDIPHIILQGAGVRHNLRFLTDYIADDDKNLWIEQHLIPLTEINTSGIVRNSKILADSDTVAPDRGMVK